MKNTRSIMSLLIQYIFVCYFIGPFTEAREKRLVLDGEHDMLAMIQRLQAKVNSLETEVAALKSTNLAASQQSGSVYVRWGRTSCPGNGTDFVYNGRMAGNKWKDYGGGSNSLCLPSDPTWSKYVDGLNSGAPVYGTEIETADNVANVLFGKPVLNEDIPCSVCRTLSPSSVMIPGRANCYPGWTLEYQGYLVSSGSGWNNVDYVCLDTGLEFATHGAANDNEHDINVAEVHCGGGGSLQCPPYVHGRELACVVCSQ